MEFLSGAPVRGTPKGSAKDLGVRGDALLSDDHGRDSKAATDRSPLRAIRADGDEQTRGPDIVFRSEQSFDQTSIDLHRGAGDVRRRVREQERADAAEIVGGAVTAERNRRGVALLLILE